MTHDPRATLKSTSDSGTLAVEEAHLVVLEGPAAGRSVACGLKPVRIGSADDNELVIADPQVSRHHAVVEPVNGRIVLRDLGSTNGTRVANVPVREAFLVPGTRVKIGASTLELALSPRQESVPLSPSTTFGELVGQSVVMRQLFTLLEWVAPTNATLLITGPTGTGKDVVARSVHQMSHRAKKPLVVLDCGAADPQLISAELFGHEAGAFTGATGRRAGVFEQAAGGTVFLDELGELPLDLQPKLLRVLESRELKRLGGDKTIPLDIRVIAATNRHLEEMVLRGKFREDLYYRLCQVKVELPALDERREDIPLIVARWLGGRRMAPEALAFLVNGSYPGNVRQLKNIVDRAALIARTDTLQLADLRAMGEVSRPVSAPAPAPAPPPAPVAPPPPPRAATGDAESKEGILAALAANDHNLMRTARALNIALNTLKTRMQKFGIPRPTARDA